MFLINNNQEYYCRLFRTVCFCICLLSFIQIFKIVLLITGTMRMWACSTLRKKSSYSEVFWPVFSRIRTEYGEILRISPYSVRMRENVDQNISEYGHFLCSR